jgi:hypothetical protein
LQSWLDIMRTCHFLHHVRSCGLVYRNLPWKFIIIEIYNFKSTYYENYTVDNTYSYLNVGDYSRELKIMRISTPGRDSTCCNLRLILHQKRTAHACTFVCAIYEITYTKRLSQPISTFYFNFIFIQTLIYHNRFSYS